VSYDRNFFREDFNKLFKEKDHLKATWTWAIVKAASLDHHIKALKKIQDRMIKQEA
jgi:hypothetical protein